MNNIISSDSNLTFNITKELVSLFVLNSIMFNDHVHLLFMFYILNLHVLLIDFLRTASYALVNYKTGHRCFTQS